MGYKVLKQIGDEIRRAKVWTCGPTLVIRYVSETADRVKDFSSFCHQLDIKLKKCCVQRAFFVLCSAHSLNLVATATAESCKFNTTLAKIHD